MGGCGAGAGGRQPSLQSDPENTPLPHSPSARGRSAPGGGPPRDEPRVPVRFHSQLALAMSVCLSVCISRRHPSDLESWVINSKV